MKFVIQRVQHASVKVDNEVKGEIQKGFLVLIGVTHNDTEEIAKKMLKKMTQLRIFEDENGKTNLSLADVDGQLLLISQFTLYADCKKGNPSGKDRLLRFQTAAQYPIRRYLQAIPSEPLWGI